MAAVWLYLLSPLDARCEELADLSLHELMDLPVSVAGKKAQSLAETAAAAFVITGEDIRRSGATSIPEALRLVPGLLVARVDASKWAVSSRSFNSLYANKMLVLLDGRTLFDALFPSVFWDVQDVLLEDIDRIEVVRGPAATLWGANAVNGVINIITRPARATQGTLGSAGGGSEGAFAALRHGERLGSDAYWRAYAKAQGRDASAGREGRGAADDWHQGRGGFRLDWLPQGAESLTVQGDLYAGRFGLAGTTFTPSSALSLAREGDTRAAGGNLLTRWKHRFAGGSKATLQLYYDWSERRGFLFGESVQTVDLDFQHNLTRGRHTLVWGAGFRHLRSDFEASGTLSMAGSRRTEHLSSLFLQDEIALHGEALTLTAGAKLEHHSYGGYAFAPSLRLLWVPRHRHSLWVAASRATRTPSRFERESRTLVPVDDTVPLRGELSGDRDFASEKVAALEAGYRFHPEGPVNLDLALFYNDYEKIRSFEVGIPQVAFSPPPMHLVVPGSLDNNLEGEVYGIELAANWQATERLQLKGAYTFVRGFFRHRHVSGDTFAAIEEDKIPRHQASLRSLLNLSGNLDLDLWLRYVDQLQRGEIPSYLELDARLAWRARPGLELSLVGQNLLDANHPEFPTETVFNVASTEVQRGVYGKLEWRF